jgi:hypothetical protein
MFSILAAFPTSIELLDLKNKLTAFSFCKAPILPEEPIVTPRSKAVCKVTASESRVDVFVSNERPYYFRILAVSAFPNIAIIYD